MIEFPWQHAKRVRNLRCRERDDSRETDDSEEVLYARIRPSAHSRPRFIKSRYRIRLHSRESDESNEVSVCKCNILFSHIKLNAFYYLVRNFLNGTFKIPLRMWPYLMRSLLLQVATMIYTYFISFLSY